MGDLEYLKGKADASNLVFATGNRTTTGVITSYTPASGKNFYLIAASIKVTSITIGSTYVAIVEVRNNAVVRDELGLANVLDGAAPGRNYGPYSKFESDIKGDKLVGNGVKTYDLNLASLTGTLEIRGNIFGWIE